MGKKGVSRRRFMKDGLSMIAGTSLCLGTFPASAGDIKRIGVSRTSLKKLIAIPTTCQLCPASCGIIAYLNGDRLVQILGNPDHPNNRGGICAQGVSGINLVNDPERLLYPLKRIGPRGSDRWSRITWDEVYLTMGSRIGRLMKEGRIEEFVVDMGQTDPILIEFIRALGRISLIDRPALKDLNQSTSFKSMTGHSSIIPDIEKSRFILNFGANPLANHEHFVGIALRLIQARIAGGARLITFDVRMSETAAKSDEWHPVKSGTDGSIALAMAHVIVKNGLADTQFIDRKTNASYEALKDHLSRHTPEWAEMESGMAAKDIERLAVQFASQKPSVAILGGGVCDHENGNQTTRCISLLNWLAGNLEEKGGIFFPRLPWERTTGSKFVRTIAQFTQEKIPIDFYFAALANPAYADSNCVESARLLKDEKSTPFLVVMDTHMTETAMLADMVLPAATYLEGWGVEPAPSLDGFPILNLRQPVVSLISLAQTLRSPSFDAGKLLESVFQPVGEAKELGNFCLQLAQNLGSDFATKLPYKNTLDYTLQTAASLMDPETSFQSLKQRGFWIDRKAQPPVKKEAVTIELSTPQMTDGQPSLPEYIPIRSQENKNPNQFILTPFKSNLGTKGMENSKWAREIFHENRLWMNKQKATQLGIKNGDLIRMTSSVGSMTLRVLTTNRIQPESVALAEGVGHSAFGSVAQARKAKSKDRDTELVWWSKKGKGQNPYSIIENRVDHEGGGPASKDTVVQVQRIEE
jgi:thiosulfate reductase/polysulfide reductase chain A